MFPSLANPSLKNGFYFVHRLDYPTSGVICIALNKNAARAASTAFEKRQVKKYYLALVHGHIDESYLIINRPIGMSKNNKNNKNSIKIRQLSIFRSRHQRDFWK